MRQIRPNCRYNLPIAFYNFSFAPPEITDEAFNTAWLYDVAARQWARWLPEEVSSTIRYGGYYTALIQPGLRVVSLNTNYCYTGNWWTLSKSQDPASSLLWLNKVLEDAERAGEKVIISSIKLKFKVIIYSVLKGSYLEPYPTRKPRLLDDF